MTTGDLLKLNNLPKTYRIYAGQVCLKFHLIQIVKYISQQLLVNSLSGNSNSVKIFSVPETRKVFVPGGIASPHMEPSSTSVSKVIPVLSTIRQQRDRQYGIEWPRSGNSSVGLSTQPLSFKRNLKYLAVEEKIETKNILNEHVHYYVNNYNNVLGELILLPKSLIFEPEVDDPIVKQLGMVLCQFQYDIKDIIDIKALEPNELFDSMLSQDLTSQRDFGSVEGKGPRFLKIKVQLKESTHKDILVLINRRSSFLFYDKLKSLLSSVETEHRVSNSVKIPISNNQSLFAPSPISMSASPTSSLLSVSPKNDLLTQQTIKDEDLAPVPTLSSPSSIVENEEDLRWLASILPNRYQNSKWNLAYSTDIHGTSLQTFYNRTKKKGPSYLIIEDEDGFVFGSFVSESWECQKGMNMFWYNFLIDINFK